MKQNEYEYLGQTALEIIKDEKRISFYKGFLAALFILAALIAMMHLGFYLVYKQ